MAPTLMPWRVVALAAAVALLPAAPPCRAVEPSPVFTGDGAGPQQPPQGRSLFDELFSAPGGYDIPYPFERLLAAVNARIAPAQARTALIPLGRSLQRFAADPDYFASPRLVVAVDAEGAKAIDQPRLKDRLYFGFQPASKTIEVISYNDADARFEFQIVSDYGGAAAPSVEYAERSICITCHQGHAPIFSRPLWSETNANPWIAGRLAGLGEVFHGARVRQGIDGPDAFDRSTDRANRIALANRLWQEGCGDGSTGTLCRATLLRAALGYRLSGARASWRPQAVAEVMDRLQARLAALWPGGLGLPDPDLPNRDPAVDVAAGRPLSEIPDALGGANPELPRDPVLLWALPGTADETYASLAREIAAMFSDADIGWLDAQLARHQPATPSRHSAACRLARIALAPDGEELRLDCGRPGDGLALRGFVTWTPAIPMGGKFSGRIDALTIDRSAALQRLEVTGGEPQVEDGIATFRLTLRESADGLNPRLVSGERLSRLTLRITKSGDDAAEIAVINDIQVLDQAIASLVAASSDSLGAGPLRRRVVLAALDRAIPGQ